MNVIGSSILSKVLAKCFQSNKDISLDDSDLGLDGTSKNRYGSGAFPHLGSGVGSVSSIVYSMMSICHQIFNDFQTFSSTESWVELNLSSQGGSGVVTPNSVNNAGGRPLPIHCTTNMEKLLMEAQRDQSRSTSRGSSRGGR